MNESIEKNEKSVGLSNLEYWQSRSPSERMDAVWKLVLDSSAGNSEVCELGLLKNIEKFGKQTNDFQARLTSSDDG